MELYNEPWIKLVRETWQPMRQSVMMLGIKNPSEALNEIILVRLFMYQNEIRIGIAHDEMFDDVIDSHDFKEYLIKNKNLWY